MKTIATTQRNTASTLHAHHSTHNVHSPLRRLTLLVTLLMTFALGARAQNYYVFLNGSGYYLENNNGNPRATTTFSPSCVWIASGTLGNTNRSLQSYIDDSDYLRGSTNSLSIGNYQSNWQMRNNLLNYNNQRFIGYQNNNFTFNSNRNSNRDFRAYSVTITTNNGSEEISFSVPSVTINPTSADIMVPEDVTFTATATESVTQTTSTQKAYTTFRFNNKDYLYEGTSDEGFGQPLTAAPEKATTTKEFALQGYNYTLSDNLKSCLEGSSTTNSITYASKNPEEEVVTGSITVTPNYGNNEFNVPSATATITVRKKLDNPTGITAEDLTLAVDEQKAISYTLEPQTAYDNVDYEIKDESIASVSVDGLVTGKKAGSTQITITAYQIDGVTPACSTTCDVTVMQRCEIPVVTINSTTKEVTITCSTEGVTIYYTTDSTDPTESSSRTIYKGSFSVGNGVTVKAIAVKDGWIDSKIGSASSGGSGETASDPYYVASVEGLNYIAEHPTYHFKVVANFDASGFSETITDFSGTFDGQYYVIRGLERPLFTSTDGATIKNVVLDDVQLTSSVTTHNITCLGAIAAYAAGNTKIYNCGILSKEGVSSISGGDHTGSLVGYIVGNTRVVNNYSYANVSGSGSEYVGGIVGRVEGTALANNNYSNDNHCAVTNNMFYGDLKGGSNVSPVYAGNHTSNVQNVNEYNFWRSKAKVSYNDYNNQLAIDKDEYLNRFPFYRHIQNTHRELAAIYLFGSRTDDYVAEIGHWYNVKNDEKVPYPIIEKWLTNTKRTTVDIANNLPNTNEKFAGKLLSNISTDGYYTGAGQQVTSMGDGGYLNVTVNINDRTYTSRLPITDMDTLNYDFTWGKVVLPFANEYEGWTRDYAKICTGWKIISIEGGTTGSLSNYNFADRDCTAKDLYSNSNYIFAQGGNYIVPYGVTAITIEANFANAYYLSDEYYDYGYDASYGGQTNLTTKVPTTYHSQTVYTSLETLVGKLSNSTDPHSQAIVLVGNYHYNQNAIGGACFNTGKAVTIMSVDEDCNQEPDYGWYSYHTESRTKVPPVRFDFLPNIGIGMAARTTGSTPNPGISIWYGHGWFELTETCVSLMSECEIQSTNFTNEDDGKGNNRWIANSGYFIQIVRTRKANCTKLSYLQIGGNAYVEQLYPGSHTDAVNTTTLCPINVTGGEIEECFMTGYKAGATATGSDIRFWCAGGKIHKYLSAYLENPSTNGVNVTAKVDHACIERFFGGGTSSSARITGNINVTMNNSLVDFYCGGPEFGDMTNGKTVTTNAIGSTFGQYFGAGFGGTSITYDRIGQQTVTFNADYTFPFVWNSSYDRLTSNNYGIGTCYDFEYILYAGGNGSGVARFYTGYAQFSLAQTGNVTNKLQHCTVKGDFYGGGCQGTVNGTVNSTLTNCTLHGNAFGGGYKAAANEVKVYPATQPDYSVYTKETGIFSDFGTVPPETYTWEYRATAGSDENNKKLYTTTDMSQLGNVTGDISIDVKGGSVAKSVFGGGNESPSKKNTVVTIQENAGVGVNVYGGGNIAIVDGNSVVNMNQGTVSGAVFGGGNQAGIGSNTEVSVAGSTIASGVYGGSNANGTVGNTQVTLTNGIIGTDAAHANVHGGGYGKETKVSGNVAVNIKGGTIYGDVYGGSALGTVNTNTNNTTAVNLTGGLVHGDAYGGGLGNSTTAADVNGNVTVTLNGTAFTLATTKDNENNIIPTSGRVFGCNNINGSPKGTVLVKVLQTVARNSDGTLKDKPEIGSGVYELQAVYGGGNLAAYNPTDPEADGQFTSYTWGEKNVAHVNTNKPVQVVIDGCDKTSIEYVYGGGNAAATPATDVTVLGSYEIGSVFGGGNGKDKYTLDGATWEANQGADVGIINAAAYDTDKSQGKYGTGNAMTSVLGGTVHNIYGGSNTKGNIVGDAIAFLDEASDCDLVVDNIYGGGNEAYMDGDASIQLGCIESLKEIYGGARNADVRGDINLTITSGHFDRVFGGNNLGGAINGSITVNIEETGCNPITIGELYGCGNKAAYTTPSGEQHPTINIRSFTGIGNVFGGGLGEKAVVEGNPTININVVKGDNNEVEGWPYNDGRTIDFGDGYKVTLPVHEKGKIGAIGNVFGGGNAAAVIGNTQVNIGTEASVVFESLTGAERTKTVEGADIRGNVYGGGNQAKVTGKTNVVIGTQSSGQGQ